MSGSVRKIFSACLIGVSLMWGASFSAHADEYSDVSRLIRTGQLPDALAQADKFLAGKPKDAQMRFLKGVILTEQNKTSDAIALFTKLTEDFPELPEPYNNLAVLYASQGQYDKARAALEMAIRTHPSYATAHENLGDVYAKLASQSYSKALQLDSNNTGAQTKLNLLTEMFSAKPSSAQAKLGTVVTPAALAAAAPAKHTPVATVPAPTPTPVAAPPAKPPVAVAAAGKPTPAAPAAPAAASNHAASGTVTAVPKPAAAPALTADASKEVLSAVEAWARAWSAKDVSGYLASYAPSFKVPGGAPRQRWEAERRTRIEDKSRIKVVVSQPLVHVQGDSATVRFRQEYSSDRLHQTSRKTLVLTRVGSRWLIQQESSGG